MRLFSGLTGILLLVLAAVFALSNRQPASIGFWPFAASVTAPLALLLLAALIGGIILGGLFTWAAMLPHQLAARRLRQDIGDLNGKLDTLQQTLTPAAETQNKPRWSWSKPQP